MKNRLIAGAAVLGLFAFGATAIALQEDNASEPELENAVDKAAPVAPRQRSGGVETIETPTEADVDSGATPMAERSAVIGLLNKRNGISRDLTLKPGQAVRIGDAVVRLSACERTAPWEPEKLTGAFVQLDVRGPDTQWRRAFSGWLYKERPNFNVVTHPIYDVWPKSCTMTFPDKGPDTTVLGTGSPAGGSRRRSSAPNAGGGDSTPAAPLPSTPEAESSAPSNNAI